MTTNNNAETPLDQILDEKKGKSKRKAKRSGANAEKVQGQLQEKFTKATRAVADATKAQILGGGIALAFAEMAEGDFGMVSESIINDLDGFIESIREGTKAIEAAESDPNYLLPASPLYFRTSDEETAA